MPAIGTRHPGASAHLILVRHGESVLGRARRYAGHRNSPLSARGRIQASKLGSRFRRLKPDIVVSSDLRRCLETAKILGAAVPILPSSGLREMDFGDWDGRTSASCRRRDRDRFDRWMIDPWSLRPPGGESLRQLRARVRRFVDSLVRRFPDRTLALITHAGPIRALVAPEPSDFWALDVPPAALFELDWKASAGSLPARGRRRAIP
jgi:broad specificity phosphatase PhoE